MKWTLKNGGCKRRSQHFDKQVYFVREVGSGQSSYIQFWKSNCWIQGRGNNLSLNHWFTFLYLIQKLSLLSWFLEKLLYFAYNHLIIILGAEKNHFNEQIENSLSQQRESENYISNWNAVCLLTVAISAQRSFFGKAGNFTFAWHHLSNSKKF